MHQVMQCLFCSANLTLDKSSVKSITYFNAKLQLELFQETIFETQ